MIISEKWKYIFIGLPFCASSAISKELVEEYDGRAILGKHSNITDLISLGFDVSEYFIFAVYRDPLDMKFTQYTKITNNSHEAYTNPEYFVENGGWVTKKARKLYKHVQSKNLDFESFIKFSHKLPFDSVYSLNKKHLDYIVDFKDINNSFKECLRKIGISPKRDLPSFNATKKKNKNKTHVNEALVTRIFEPFYYYNGQSSSVKSISLHNAILFKTIQLFRFFVWKRRDLKRRSRSVAGNKDFLMNSKVN